ncbi:MAG: hypothetical protein ACXVH8_03750, partial [Halobacteriota archaeon]
MKLVPIDLFPGHPITTAAGLVIKISISVAIDSGALGSQVTPLYLFSWTGVLTADHGVTILNANVCPSAKSDGLDHFSRYRSLNVGIAPLTSSSNVLFEYAVCHCPDS